MERPDTSMTQQSEAPALRPAPLRFRKTAMAMWAYGSTVLVGAFLLFSIQPIAGKVLLPRLGGSTSVWSATLLFFMTALLVGYAYAYVLCKMRVAMQILLHTAVLLAVCLSAAINLFGGRLLFHQTAYASSALAPFSYIFLFLTTQIALPYILLSATSTLLQVWFGRVAAGRVPYRLYAFSNAGSLAAVAAYPFVIEPYLPLSLQMRAWLAMFLIYGAGMLVCMGYVFARSGTRAVHLPPFTAVAPEGGGAGPRLWKVLCWIGLAGFASFQLITTTATMTQGIAAVPLFWLVPLSLYLLSYVLCFSGERWYSRMVWASLLFVGSFFSVAVWTHMLISVPVLYELAIYSSALFCLCMVCHGELYHIRPDTRFISGFYLASAFGGALGGFMGSIISPIVFTRGLYEFPFGFMVGGVVGGLLLLYLIHDLFSPKKLRILRYAVVAALILPFMVTMIATPPHRMVEATRNFYGVLKIEKETDIKSGKSLMALYNGRILHGNQFLDPALRRAPTTYYGTESGAGLALRFHPARVQHKPLRVGVVGLGVGTLAAYCQKGDTFRFYEINPAVIRVAREYFSYLEDCPGAVSIVTGDARVALEEELWVEIQNQFDVLLIDAFTDDAIPVHLLTREAFALYRAHMTGSAILGVHISNNHLDLGSLVSALARDAGWDAVRVDSAGISEQGGARSQWMLIAPTDSVFQADAFRSHISPAVPERQDARKIWTDDYSSIFQVLRNIWPW